MTALRIEAVLTWAYAAGFGGSTIPVAIYLRRYARLPTFFGFFEMFGGPWYARFARRAFAWLLTGFLFVTLLAAWAAWLVWDASRLGGVLTAVLLPVEAAFWFGFDLPIPKVIGLVRLSLLILGWRSLT